MSGVIAGLSAVAVVGVGIGVYVVWAAGSNQPAASAPSTSATRELQRLREAESDVERTCRETQEAIIRRAMWHAARPHGGGERD
jgi:hypothetical protein